MVIKGPPIKQVSSIIKLFQLHERDLHFDTFVVHIFEKATATYLQIRRTQKKIRAVLLCGHSTYLENSSQRTIYIVNSGGVIVAQQ